MPETAALQSVCSQLLQADDLKISTDLYERIISEEIVSKIFINKEKVSVKIYSTQMLHLSCMTPVLHDFGF
jgi:hypothetical protein